jgi:N-methylhydantoinase A
VSAMSSPDQSQTSSQDLSPSVVVGIDVGGTFTDVFSLDDQTGAYAVAKVTSTRRDEAQGFLTGVRAAAGDDLGRIAAIIHGTTVGTNALLERKGARTGIIATEGFADVLEMRRRDRPRTWGLWGDFKPVVSRDLRIGVSERVLADGTVVETVNPDDVVAAAKDLLDKGAIAVAISFLHSYANDDNEAAAAAALRAVWPNEYVSVSSEILPEIREFERTSTTALNAYLQPVVGGYLARLETDLVEAGFSGEFLVVQSNGGVMTVETARRFPVRTALSGPAAGVIAAQRIAGAAGHPNVLTADMGGTSFDIAVIANGSSVLTDQVTIDFGLVIRSPMIEVTTIGAGGGSIAWVDRGGLLQIGPESAGGVPGPACYGQGNTRPTVTDASVVLGRINAKRPIGARLELDIEASRNAIAVHVADPLGLSVETAAEAILRVAESRMAGALRLVSIERGHDPTGFWIMPFGGAGALHCCAFLRDVHLAGAVVPPRPGVISALGCVIADMRYDAVRTIGQPLAGLDLARLQALLVSTLAASRTAIEESGVRFVKLETEMSLDMSYVGQTHTVNVPLSIGDPAALTSVLIQEAFEKTYLATYGRLLNSVAVRVLSMRSAVIGVRPPLDLGVMAPKGPPGVSQTGTRQVFFHGAWHESAIHDRLALAVGESVVGPAILEQPDATIVLEPGFGAVTDDFGNLKIRSL